VDNGLSGRFLLGSPKAGRCSPLPKREPEQVYRARSGIVRPVHFQAEDREKDESK
jgi:hypothetical protein